MEMRLCIVIDWGALSFFLTEQSAASPGFINACTDELSLWGKKTPNKAILAQLLTRCGRLWQEETMAFFFQLYFFLPFQVLIALALPSAVR